MQYTTTAIFPIHNSAAVLYIGSSKSDLLIELKLLFYLSCGIIEIQFINFCFRKVPSSDIYVFLFMFSYDSNKINKKKGKNFMCSWIEWRNMNNKTYRYSIYFQFLLNFHHHPISSSLSLLVSITISIILFNMHIEIVHIHMVNASHHILLCARIFSCFILLTIFYFFFFFFFYLYTSFSFFNEQHNNFYFTLLFSIIVFMQ